MDTKRRILVSTALPYANGAIHIGHMLEHIQASVWTNAMRMDGHEVHHVCADDAHGTPVMLRAEADGVKPEELITQMREEHIADFEGFRVKYDCYHTTHSDENRELSEGIYRKLRDADLIDEREVEQMYDADKGIFLPDRYVKGECPRCQAPEQFGDSCSKCGAAYSPVELGNPVSVISGTRPEIRKSNHFFFKLNEKQDLLNDWVDEKDPGPGPGPRLHQSARNKLREWLGGKLRDWDISRDAPYFGFKIPDTKDKYFYVWLDAPIGYLASFRKLCDESADIDFDEFVRPGTNTEMYHFIGKDILYFHGLFWPAVLDGAGMRTPTRLFAHGFLSVNGEKMSKSKGTFITARSYLDLKLDPEWLRYYLASKLSDRMEDIDLNFDDFVNQVNADLVGKLANIPSRVAPFLKGGFENKLSKVQPDWNLWQPGDISTVARHYEKRQYREVIRSCMFLAGQVNQKLEQNKPWELARGLDQVNSDDEAGRTNGEILQDVCSYAIQSFRILVGLLKPILPRFAEDAEEFLKISPLTWDQLVHPLPEGHVIGEFKHLMKRIQPKQIVRLVDENRESEASAPATRKKKKSNTDTITIDDFKAVDLRIAKVLAAEAVAESKKLLKVTVDVGDLGQRTIFAGIQEHVDPASLVGKSVVMCANLAPRKMRFGTSEGMILAAETADGKLSLLVPDGEIDPGAKIS